MRRPLRVILIAGALAVVAALAAGCGTQKISVPKSDPTYAGAVLFSQRCSGCHTLSYAGTRGSAANVRTREIVNGPNFNVRCERPVTRILYAIENGGFSGATMPQNIVVGQQAHEVAEFVAKYAGRAAPKEPGAPTCVSQPIGTLPSLASATTASAPATTTTAQATTGPSQTAAATGSQSGTKTTSTTSGKAKKKK
jgi:mono/diheme cytochrome c family protein